MNASKECEMAQKIPGSREEDAWLSEEQLAKCQRADEADALHPAIPTQMVSNGEYMPDGQTERQKQVEARVRELADHASKKLGLTRRRFLATSGGMAASLLAMNEVFGRFFDVKPIELFEPAAAAEAGLPSNLFVFDDQLHMIRGRPPTLGFTALRALAEGPSSPGFLANPFNPGGLPDEFGNPWGVWDPALVGLPITAGTFEVTQFIKDVFLDSQVTVAMLTGVPATVAVPTPTGSRPPRNITEAIAGEILTVEQAVAARDFINTVSGSQRAFAHGRLYPGVGNLDYIHYQAQKVLPDCWKGYNIATSAKVDSDPNSDMRIWRLDDEAVAYPTYEAISSYREKYRKLRPGWNNISIHKGLAPGDPDIPERGNPTDVPKAARDWPNLNFIIYHSCIRPSFFNYPALQQARSGVLRGGVPDIEWTSQFAQLAEPYPNVYGELGHTFASSIITFPTVWAHIIGQLLIFLGEDRIVFGSDCIWYGAPQWQLEAFWRFQIPEELQARWDYPRITERAKRKILGLNSARLYGIRGVGNGEIEDDGQPRYLPVPSDYASRMTAEFKTIMEFPGYVADSMHRAREAYLARGGFSENTRYGWIRRSA
jgi:hypothetical protein